MLLYDLNEKKIEDLCSHGLTYMRGVGLSKNKNVVSLKYDNTCSGYTAMVKDVWIYKTGFFIDTKSELSGFFCSCGKNRDGAACEHVAATLTAFYEMRKTEIEAERANRAALALLMGNLSDFGRRTQGSPETLTVTPKFILTRVPAEDYTVHIQLTVENKKKYIIKNILEFVQARKNQERYEFGKMLTYDPAIHEIDPCGAKILGILEAFQDASEYWKDVIHYHINLYERAKLIRLTGKMLYTILALYRGKTVLVQADDKLEKEFHVLDEAPPLQLVMAEEGENLSLELAKTDLPFTFYNTDNVYWHEDKFYLIHGKKAKLVSSIFKSFQNLQANKLNIGPEQKSGFISEILPVISKLAGIQAPRSLKQKIVQTAPDISVYLDQFQNGILAAVRFQYGEVVFDGASGAIVEGPRDYYVIRQTNPEEEILRSFENMGFLMIPEGFYLENEDEIFNFIYRYLPHLQEKVNIFFSDDFKKLKIKRQFRINGRVTIEDGLLSLSLDTNDFDREELLNILQTLRKKKKYYRLKTGEFLPMEEFKDLEAISRFAEEMDIKLPDLADKAVQLPGYRAMYLDALLRESPNRHIRRTELFQQFIEKFSNPDTAEDELHEPLGSILRDYQKTGYKWLKNLSDYGMGGILADDMGLGKTLQMLALLQTRGLKTNVPSLVVAPTTLVYVWQQEAEKFVPNMKVLVVIGKKDERNQLFQEIPQADLVVTSYPLIRRDIDSYRNMRFNCLVLDEAQHVKNYLSQAAKAVRLIPAGHRFAMTGTPMENSLLELWSIFDFIMPGYLYNLKKFEKYFSNPILNGKDDKAAQELSFHIRPFILRRLKKDVLHELPEKIETALACEMTEAQKKVYSALLMQVREEMARDIAALGYENVQLRILAAMMRLRQVCCHPATFMENYEGGSGKMEMLLEILQETISSGHRILLFSQFTSMLEIIRAELCKMEIGSFYLSGSTPVKDRRDMVKQFNEGQNSVFLLSLKAGGTGLTLTGADTVIHYDPWWNPAAEDQATDRAYRIGQENVVQVFKLVTRNSIEEKIVKLQEQKKELIDRIIQPGENLLHKMTREELESLFSE